MNRLILIAFPLLALSCVRGQIFPGEAKPEAYACFQEPCASPIDNVVNPAFTCRLTPVSLASPKELCRRLFVDLLGRLPTDEDFAAQCEGKTLDQTIETLFAHPDYVMSRQKLWAKRFGYNDARTWYQDTIGLDLLVKSLYEGKLTIADFVERAAIHPGVLTTADGQLTAYVERSASPRIDARTLSKGPDADAFTERVFETLLFRSPTAVELAEFPNLYRQFEIDPVAADPDLPGFTARQLRISPCNCAGAKKAFCQTQGIGLRDVSLPLPFPGAADCAAEPGNSYTFKQLTEDQKLVAARDILKAAGNLLVQREDFFTQYARETLDRLLGYDVIAALGPVYGDAALTALADSFKTDGNIRNLEANVLRSVFYRQAQNPDSPAVDCDNKPSPLYAGPRKTLDAEAFIASASNATAHDFGACDYRLQGRPYQKVENNVTSPAFAPPSPPSLFATVQNPTTNATEPDYAFRDLAQSVGACPNNVTKITVLDTGAFTQMGYDFIAREACEKGSKGAMSGSDTSDPALGANVDYQFSRFFLEAPTAEEKTAGLTAMKGCLASTQTCAPDAVGKRFCAALLKSSRFLTY